MSRRKAIDYDDDYYDDGYYDDDNDDDYHEEVEDGSGQYLYNRDAAENNEAADGHRLDPSQAELLDTLAEGLRECFGDERIAREDIDAVLVAADYDIDSAMAMLSEQRAQKAAEDAKAVDQLQAAEASPIARMLDSEQDGIESAKVKVPFNTRAGDDETTTSFAFDEPSPDDLIRQQREAGKARASVVASRVPSKAVLPAKSLRGGVVDVVGRAGRSEGKLPVTQSATNSTASAGRSSSGAARDSDSKRNPKRGTSSALPSSATPITKQRTRSVKLPSPVELTSRSPSVSVVVAGHVDAGKSTLLGHLLQLVNADSEGSARSRSSGKRRAGRPRAARGDSNLAWTTDEDAVEQERGVTIDIATRTFRGQKTGTNFCIIDAPGHRDYVPAMILGACQANAALLVLDASTGEFEAGFSEEGQTREHAVLLRSLGVSRLVVVVNKMDMVNFSESRFLEICEKMTTFLKSLGWRTGKDVVFVPASGLSGTNLVGKHDKKGHSLSTWYNGLSVLDALEALPSATAQEIDLAMKRPTRLVVSDAFRSSSLGGVIAVSGRLVSGTVAGKDRLHLSPTTGVVMVKSIEVGQVARKGEDGVAIAAADGLPVSLGLIDVVDSLVISPGDVLGDPESPVPVTNRFRGQVVTIATPVPLVQGVQVELHLSGMSEAATISKLVEVKSGSVEKRSKRPRRLQKGETAVVEITVSRPICVELASDVKFLGRFALRCHGRTVAAGLVSEILKTKLRKPSTEMGASCVTTDAVSSKG